MIHNTFCILGYMVVKGIGGSDILFELCDK